MIRLLLLNAFAWAQEGAEHAAEHGAHEAVTIPWWNITVQALNFFLFFGLLTFLLRKPIKKYFADRASEYREMVDRAENARREAEANRDEIRARMTKLEASARQGVEDANREAKDLRDRLMTEAKDLSAKLEKEAKRSASVELEKAKAELRAELLKKALASSNETLSKGLGSSEQKKLQNEFVEKIEVVGR